jgi:hypothetical protein
MLAFGLAMRASRRLGKAIRAQEADRLNGAVEHYSATLELCRRHPDPTRPFIVGTYLVALSNLAELRVHQTLPTEAHDLAVEGLTLIESAGSLPAMEALRARLLALTAGGPVDEG